MPVKMFVFMGVGLFICKPFKRGSVKTSIKDVMNCAGGHGVNSCGLRIACPRVLPWTGRLENHLTAEANNPSSPIPREQVDKRWALSVFNAEVSRLKLHLRNRPDKELSVATLPVVTLGVCIFNNCQGKQHDNQGKNEFHF